MVSEGANSTSEAEEVVSVELPAPEGWKKKFTPKRGGTPRRNEITFISPTGVEITNKRQLDQHLRAHPGGPPSSEFDWGTGDTPRRSSRLSAKAKATETPEGEKPKKRERKPSGKKGTKDKKDSGDGENKAPEAADEAKESAFAEMEDNKVSIDRTTNAHLSVAEGEAEKASKEKTNDDVKGMVDEGEAEAPKDAVAADEAKGSEYVEMKNNEGEAENVLGENTNENVDAKTGGHDENKSSEKANQASEEKGCKDAEKEKPESFEPSKEDANEAKGRQDRDAYTENDEDIPMVEQHQPRASPVNC